MICHSGKQTGLGHLSRTVSISNMLKKKFKANIKILIIGKLPNDNMFNIKSFKIIDLKNNFSNVPIKDEFDLIFFDLDPKFIPTKLSIFLDKVSSFKAKLISIDGLMNFASVFDLIFIPSFYIRLKKNYKYKTKIVYGWDSYILNKKKVKKIWKPGNTILVLTGGSDIDSLGKSWPKLFEKYLPKGSKIIWISGPFAKKIDIPINKRIYIKEYRAIKNLNNFIYQANYAVTYYGVSFFELLYANIPTVTFPAKKHKSKLRSELNSIKQFNLSEVARDKDQAIKLLIKLIKNNKRAFTIATNARKMVKVSGLLKLEKEIKKLI